MVSPRICGIILNPFEVQRITFKLLKSAKEEILIAFSTANALRRQERVGSIGLLKKAAKRGVKVRILTPEDDRLVEIKLKLESQKIDIRYIEESSQISYLIVDRKSLLVVELRDDQKKLPSKPWDFQLTPPGGPLLYHMLRYSIAYGGKLDYINNLRINYMLQKTNWLI